MNSDLAALIVTCVVTALLFALTSYGQKKKAEHIAEHIDESGKLSRNAMLLEYPIGISILAIVAMLFFLAVFVYGVLVAEPVPPEERAAVVTVSLIVVIVLPWVLYLEAGGTYIVLTEDGIRKRSYYTGKRYIRWDEIRSVSFSSIAQQFALHSDDSKITAHLYLNGISDLAKQIQDRLRPEIWEKAKDLVEALAMKSESKQ